MAAFVARASYDDLSEMARRQLKIRILDSLGCAIGALGGEPVRLLRAQIEDFGGSARSTLIGGGRTSPDQRGVSNTPPGGSRGFNASFLARGGASHPAANREGG